MDLIQRCQAGDQEALAALFRQYANLVYKTAYLLLGDAQAAEDALQEVFLKVYRSLGTFEPEKGAFTTWLKDRKVNLNVSRDKFFKAMKALGIEATQSREYDRKRVYMGYKCHSVTCVQPPLLAEKQCETRGGVQCAISDFGKQGEFQQCDNVTPQVGNVTTSHPLTKVKVLVDIPYVIIGVDGKTYGPFRAGDVAEIPRENALLLAHRGLVEILDQDDRR
ncbi:MAG: hypothetical protein APZ16_04415 [Candidatus Hadarchaeum yellowstonense]|uniref:Uncharacterized protein n=1 Tax=Hadarchaeum yellowstonense TaxID=1776334 RepID=A0A147JVS3_HADYE|nr:MAG: hypothetical protein APZ16_04415 [Candidatus Hadarchaeum yellowstonense]